MNHTIKYLILGLAVLGGLTACNKQLIEEPQASVNTHRVYFSSGTAQTKTGISVDENMMTPDWRKTAAANVHLFEIGSKGYSIGKDVTITPSEDNLTAHFSADFPTDMTIIVNPSKNAPTLTVSNEPNVGPYFYAAVVAKAAESAYIVPAVQHPDAETLIDPDADFLIGYSRKSYEAAHNFDEPVVDLYFDRPVALGRINISNFTEDDEIVKSVAIKAPGLSGSAAYSAVDFENASVTFTPDVVAEGETAALTLDYGMGADLEEDGTFGAYFVVLPGKPMVSEIVVTTDKWVYTKTVGREITFSNISFKNLKLDLTDVPKVAPTPEAPLTWYKASMLEDGINYLIVSAGQALKNNEGATAAVSVTDNEGVITLEAADPTIVWTATAKTYTTGDNGEGGVVAGHFTLTNNGYYLRRQSNTDILLDTTVPSDKPKYVVWDYDGSYLKHESSETATFFCFYNNGWSTGYTSNGAAPGSDIKTVQIYTSRAPQELTFTPAASAEYDLATSEWTVAVPTLGGAQTAVTYALSEDSNPEVATVDADGTVHPLSRGIVTIVATAAGNDQYQAASASYTLRVVDSSVTTKTYSKVTSTADLEAGAQYILVYETSSKAFKPILNSGGTYFTKSTANALDVTISDGVIESSDLADCEITLEAGYYLYIASVGKYLYPGASGDSALGAEDKTSDHTIAVSFDSNGIVTISRSGDSNYHLYWSRSSYFSGINSNSSSYAPNICLYKLDDGREAQELSFTPGTATYDLYAPSSFVKPTLSTAYGAVTYSSSNDAIATVDNSGNITGYKKGTVTITANAAGDTGHKPGSASYELEVIDTTPIETVTVQLKKATSASAGKQYVLVSNGKVLVRNEGDTEEYDFDSNNLSVSVPSSLRDNLEWTLQSSSNLFKNGDYYFGIVRHATGTYTYRVQLSTTTTNIDGDSNDSMPNLTIDTSGDYIYYTGNSSAYFMYFDTSEDWTTYKITKANSYTHSYKTALYEVVDSRTPQELVFSSSSAEYDLGTSTWTVAVPSLSGAINAVTYESSDPTVATVTNAGVVTPLKKGITTITARAAESATYQPGEASYKLTVKNSLVKDVYQRVTSTDQIVSGGKYIFVYENGDTKKAFKPVLNSGKTAFEQTAANAIDVTITNDEIDPSTVEGCQIVFSNQDGTSLKFNMLVPKADGENDYYFCLRNNSSSFVASTEDPGYRPTIALDSNGVMTISRSQNSSNYRFRYSSSNSSFQASTSSSSNLYLFKLEDGSNP